MTEYGQQDEPTSVIETEEGTLGEAQRPDSHATRGRAEEPGLLPQEDLDELQEELRTTRRPAGPEREPEVLSRGEAEEEVPDVPPTETEEPQAPEEG